VARDVEFQWPVELNVDGTMASPDRTDPSVILAAVHSYCIMILQ
jgi:hypothetical protein